MLAESRRTGISAQLEACRPYYRSRIEVEAPGRAVAGLSSGPQLYPGGSRHHPSREATCLDVGVDGLCPGLVAETLDPTREEPDERSMAMPLHTRGPRCYANAHEAVRDCDSCRFYPGRARLHSP